MGNVRYFSHDRDAFSDPHIEDMRADYGMEGYGTYWAIVENMCMEPDLALPYTEKKAKTLQTKMGTSFNMKKFIDTCIDCKLFETDGKRFWSKSLRARLASLMDISEKRSRAAYARWERVRAGGNDSEEAVEAIERKNSSQGDYELSVDSVDQNWLKVAQCYESQIGLLPTGMALDQLIADYETLGADAMIAAIQKTNLDQPSNPRQYLGAILKSFVEQGIDSKEKAEAEMGEFERRRRQGSQVSESQASKNVEEVRWF